MIVNVCGAAGGVGTTSVASAVALEIAADRAVLLEDRTGTGDTFVTFGLAVPVSPTAVQASTRRNGAELWASDGPGVWPESTDVVVRDWGTTTSPIGIELFAELTVLVVTSRYGPLRRAMNLGVKPDIVVARTVPSDALSIEDVRRVFGGVPVVEMVTDPAVARALDSGLFSSRLPESLRQMTVQVREVVDAAFEAAEVAR